MVSEGPLFMAHGGGTTSSLAYQKVSKIFQRFDVNCDGHLNRDEMSALVVAVNPRMHFDEAQMDAILHEVFRNYGDYIDDEKGLSVDGLHQTYLDGAGDIDRDFNELGLQLDTEVEADKKDKDAKANGPKNHDSVTSESNGRDTRRKNSRSGPQEEGVDSRKNSRSGPREEGVDSRKNSKSGPRDEGVDSRKNSRSGPQDEGVDSRKNSRSGPQDEGVDSRKNSRSGPQDEGVDSRVRSSRRSKGSWTGSLDDGIEDLTEDLGILISQLEASMAKKGRGEGAGSVKPVGWARNVVCAYDTGEVVRSWEDLGQDYVQFQKGLAEIRKKADASRRQQEAFEAHLATGRALFTHKLYREALVSFKKAAELKPLDVRPHFQLGNAFYALGKIADARQAYSTALSTTESDSEQWVNLIPQIHVNLGITLEAQGMLFAASEHYKKAAIKEPKHYRALKLLGSALYGVGEYKAAKDALEEAISLHEDYADAHCELGSVLHALGDHKQAVAEFQRALDLKTDHIESLYNLATLLKDIGQYKQAALTYSKVLAMQPQNWRAQLNKAVSLLGAGEIDESKRAFKEAYKMTGRSELYDAIVHLQHMEKRFSGLPSILKRGENNSGIIGESFRTDDNFILVESARFQTVNKATPRHLLAYALDMRYFQSCTKFNQCDIIAVEEGIRKILVTRTERRIRKEEFEKVMRRLFCSLKPEAFQASLKAINEKVLNVLDPHGIGMLELGLVFAILALVFVGPLEKRKQLAFKSLCFHCFKHFGGEIPKKDVEFYLKKLRAVYLPSPVMNSFSEYTDDDDDDDETCVSYSEFVEMLDDHNQGFQILNILEKLEMEDHSRHGWQTCSVCCYTINGPRFKEITCNFNLCSLCYSSGKVPANVRPQQCFRFKEINSELDALKDRLQIFRSPFASCSEIE